MQAMSKFYTATCQAKELATEAKTAKDKAKELGHEVLLKKGEVIRLTEDFNRLLGSETKLKNEVEELKADNLEKDTRIVHLEGQVQSLPRPWRRHVRKQLLPLRSLTSIRIV